MIMCNPNQKNYPLADVLEAVREIKAEYKKEKRAYERCKGGTARIRHSRRLYDAEYDLIQLLFNEMAFGGSPERVEAVNAALGGVTYRNRPIREQVETEIAWRKENCKEK